ncbi:hypothetical protein D477_013800 [Arthrobacter crystallopoietes BAB-32]|uniref:ER-bound oxygenase mpaB/mpaB'/Rubber oxygenase catalytic domain-containing protein n=1 Tax=Arthrobacter crystallopoietes BAB-32 TaxID=1246476 RepID=N1V5X0_9MICC|nr:oxygenase MpaB family protein [Arthrobacter crystallopoietes]EMY33648.1 hypothetical protein D477_013800 [Arthrobacter crystallopoietes BAB-32]
MGAISALRQNLRRTVSGSPEVPAWSRDLANGTDAGFFGPDSAVWALHGSITTLVGGIRALLVQSLHPGALAGVDDFSMYREQPLVRLAGTGRWIATVTYGDTATATAACQRILKLHERVQGTYTDARGAIQTYSANDPQLLKWVHLAFMEAFLAGQAAYGGPLPGGEDRYIAEWATAGELMQVPDPPRSRAELDQQLAAFRPELVSDAKVAAAVNFIRHPPLPRSQRLGYRILFAGAVETLEPHYLELLGLRKSRLGPLPLPVRTATRLVLALIALGLGNRPASEGFARRRIARLKASTTQ